VQIVVGLIGYVYICNARSFRLYITIHVFFTIPFVDISLYGAETWSVTATSSRKIDSLDNYSALGESSTSTGQSLSPMMRFVAVLGNHCCQTLSGVVVCPSLAISTEQIHARTTTELCRPALRTLLQIGDEGLAVPDNRGSERWRPTCVH